MKIRFCAVALMAVLCLTLFSGCQAGAVENRLEQLEETIENVLDPEPSRTAPKLTAEEAEAIALADAGLTPEQVTRLRSEYDVDRGVGEYDVEFHHDGWEYDYEIHADNGEILFKDKERDN